MFRTPVLLLAGVLALTACFEEEPKQYEKNQFAAELAQAACNWAFTCCDSAERDTWLGGTLDQSACVSSLTSKYSSLFASADPEQWNGTDAVTCVDDITEAATACPRSFDVDVEMDACALVTPTKKPGDLCQSNWDCSTKFCKSGVCANPLTDGNACAPGERCAQGLKCVNSVCIGLQPDGAACTIGAECISGACGGGKCVAAANYSCDGK